MSDNIDKASNLRRKISANVERTFTVNQLTLPFHHEITVDLFAGGGGASTGIENAIGRAVDVAVNHDPEAIAVHQVNHPLTKHLISDVFEVDPLVATEGHPVGLLWASPDCKHFSKAKGGKPVSKRVRGLAWVVVKWAKAVRPRVIILENVEEFQTWGPLTDSGIPDPATKGQTFELWKTQLKRLGYHIEHKELRACDYGAPTIRKRFFMVARCDGQPIIWPHQTHAHAPKAGQQPWLTAADIIDFSLPCPSIFERRKPLADATCRRIAAGIMRYVVDNPDPFIIPGAALCPSIVSIANWSSMGVHDASKPLTTVTANPKGGHHALVSAFLAKHYTGVVGSSLQQPIGTVTSIDHHSLITSHLCKLRGTNIGAAATEPLHTISAQGTHHDEVRAFLMKYYGSEKDGVPLTTPIHTIPTRDRFGLVTVHGVDYQIVDIGLRMLTPRELYRAQGFPDSYVIDRKSDGSPITKTAQVRMCGNSVCPPLAAALVAANYSVTSQIKKRRAVR